MVVRSLAECSSLLLERKIGDGLWQFRFSIDDPARLDAAVKDCGRTFENLKILHIGSVEIDSIV